jgi:tetratricopeptide (TPR) repeat protein
MLRKLLAMLHWELVSPLATVAFGVVAVPHLCGAHGPTRASIEELTRRIRSDSGSAELYLQRGELYRVDRDEEAALRDFERAARLDPTRAEVDLYRGRLALESGRYRDAEAALSRFLAGRPGHALARALRARASARSGRWQHAAEDYSAAIALEANPSPELYLERARVLAEAGDDQLGEALRSLDAGIERLGDVVTLDLYAIELELRRGDCDGALRRLDRIASHAARQDPWLARRGEILEAAGREREAREAYRGALEALEAVGGPRRHTPATTEREARLRGALARLEPGLEAKR